MPTTCATGALRGCTGSRRYNGRNRRTPDVRNSLNGRGRARVLVRHPKEARNHVLTGPSGSVSTGSLHSLV